MDHIIHRFECLECSVVWIIVCYYKLFEMMRIAYCYKNQSICAKSIAITPSISSYSSTSSSCKFLWFYLEKKNKKKKLYGLKVMLSCSIPIDIKSTSQINKNNSFCHSFNHSVIHTFIHLFILNKIEQNNKQLWQLKNLISNNFKKKQNQIEKE